MAATEYGNRRRAARQAMKSAENAVAIAAVEYFDSLHDKSADQDERTRRLGRLAIAVDQYKQRVNEYR